MKKYLILIAAALTLLCGCDASSNKDYDPEMADNADIKVLKSDLVYDNTGGCGSVIFKASDKVRVVSSQRWCKADVVDNRTVSLEIDKSNSYESRYATVTISCRDYSTSVTVHQFGIRVFEFDPDSVVEFGKDGGSICIPYVADCPLTISSDREWAIADWNEDGLTITVGEFAGERFATITWDIQGASHGRIKVSQDGQWKDLGSCSYTDGFISAAYEVEDFTYPVRIQENISKVGLYRLINPYGAAYPANEKGDWDSSKTYFMYIDATDHDNVRIESFDSGCNWGYGSFQMSSTAGGKFRDDVITFPAEGLAITLPDYSSTPLPANVNGSFKIDLTGLYK